MRILNTPDKTTAANAPCHDKPNWMQTNETKNVVIEGAGATANGNFAIAPIMKVAAAAETTVAKKAALISIPAFESNIGFRRKMYESVR